jgi:hypothetical protein
MSVDAEYVRKIFAGLEHGEGTAFFDHVAEDVDWTVMGTHPLAGHYTSKADFVAGTFAKLAKVLPDGAESNVDNLIVKRRRGDRGIAFGSDRQERFSLRQSLLLGLLFQGRQDRARARLSRFCDGCAIVCREPDRLERPRSFTRIAAASTVAVH